MTDAERQELHHLLAAGAARAHARRGMGAIRRVSIGGLGDAASDLRAMPLPGALERYLATGAPMSTWKRDLGAATAQIPRWVYGLGAVLSIFFGAKAYQRWRDAK